MKFLFLYSSPLIFQVEDYLKKSEYKWERVYTPKQDNYSWGKGIKPYFGDEDVIVYEQDKIIDDKLVSELINTHRDYVNFPFYQHFTDNVKIVSMYYDKGTGLAKFSPKAQKIIRDIDKVSWLTPNDTWILNTLKQNGIELYTIPVLIPHIHIKSRMDLPIAKKFDGY